MGMLKEAKTEKKCPDCGLIGYEADNTIQILFGYRFDKDRCVFNPQSRCRKCRIAWTTKRRKERQEATKKKTTSKKTASKKVVKLVKKESPAMQRLRRSYVRKFPNDKQFAKRTKEYMQKKLAKVK